MTLHQSLLMIFRTFYMFSSVWHVERYPEGPRPSVELSPCLNEENQSELVFLPWPCHRKLFWTFSCLSSIVSWTVKHSWRPINYSLENGRYFLTGTTVNAYWEGTQSIMAAKSDTTALSDRRLCYLKFSVLLVGLEALGMPSYVVLHIWLTGNKESCCEEFVREFIFIFCVFVCVFSCKVMFTAIDILKYTSISEFCCGDVKFRMRQFLHY